MHKSKWVYAIKYNNDGSVEKIKARFVACGYSQSEGSDFDKVFAATLPGVGFRLLCTWIADEDLETDHIDAVKAFTQADVDRLIYVEMPEGFEVAGFVLVLYKALEGIKQGAYLWFQHNKAAWLKLGFKSWINEPNLYIHPELRIRVGVFADDTLAGYKKAIEDQYIAIKDEYSKLINIGTTTISPVLKFTGVQISRDRSSHTLTISQERYIEQLAEDYKSEIKKVDMPFGSSKDERAIFNSLVPATDKDVKVDRGLYLKLCGKIVWPSSMTRPDISMAVSTLCGFVHAPTELHYKCGLHVVSYLSSTRTLGITYGGNIRIPLGLTEHPPRFIDSCGLYGIHDASFGTRGRPMGGFVIMCNNGAVDWAANNLKVVPQNSNEAESAAGSRGAKAMLYARALSYFHGRVVTRLTPMLGDNKALYEQMQQDGASARTRYYERAILLLKRAVLLLIFRPFLVTTDNMVADILTKATDKGTFYKMRAQMMNVHVGLRQSLEEHACTMAGDAARIARNLVRRM